METGRYDGGTERGRRRLIWDRPVAGGGAGDVLREALLAEVNRLGVGCAYRFEKGCARAILTGTPEAPGELLVRLR